MQWGGEFYALVFAPCGPSENSKNECAVAGEIAFLHWYSRSVDLQKIQNDCMVAGEIVFLHYSGGEFRATSLLLVIFEFQFT